MAALRWLRIPRGRPRLLLVGGVILAVIFGLGFVDLALTRRAMLERSEQVQAEVEQMEEQNTLLQQELERAQKGLYIPYRAWEYFGAAPRGAGVIVAEPAPTAESAQAAPAGPSADAPFWRRWLNRLPHP